MHPEIMAWFAGIPIGWLLIFILWFVIWAPLVAILEYGVHRWIMHKASRVLDPQLDHLKSHAAHHGGSNTGEFVDVPLVDCVLLTSPAFILLSAWGLAVGPFSAVVIPAAALLAWCFLYAYLWTRIHRAIHGVEANWFRRCGRVFRFFCEHHFKHHANAKVNYGAVFPWTDYMFLTSGGPTVDRLRRENAARTPNHP